MSASRTVKIEILGDGRKAQQALAGVESSADGLLSKLGSAGKVAAVAGAAVGGAFLSAGVAGTLMAADTESAVDRLQAQLGLTEEAAAGLGDVAQSVFAGAWGDSVGSVTEDISILRRNLGDMSDEATRDLTEAALTIEDLFGAGVEETSKVVKTLRDNFDGLSETQAFDLITTGFQRGGDYAGDLLDTLNEYAPQFASMGFAADEMLGILIAGAESGAFNLDKVGDAVKEFNIRAKDGSASTAAGFEAIGLSATEMGSAIAEGGERGEQAFMATIAALAAMEDPVARNQAGVALFGSTWEDLEADVVTAMVNGAAGIEDFEGATDRAADAAYSNLGTALESLKRTGMVLLSDAMLPLVGVLTDVATWATGQMPAVQSAIEGGFEAIGDILGPVIDGAGELLSLLRDGDWSGAAGVIVSALSSVGSLIVDGLLGGLELVADAGSRIATWLIGQFSAIDWSGLGTAFVNGLFAGVEAIADFGTRLLTWASNQLASVDWTGLGTTLVSGLITGVTAITDFGQQLVTWIATAITEVDWLGVATSVKDGILGALLTLIDFGQQLVDWISSAIAEVDWLGTATAIKDGILGALTQLVDWGSQFVDWVSGALSGVDWTGAATSIRDGITGASAALDWSGLATSITGAFEGLGSDGGLLEPVIEQVQSLWDTLGPFGDFLSGEFGGIIESFRETWDGLVEAFSELELGEVLPALEKLGIVVGAVLGVALAGLLIILGDFAELLSVVIPVAAEILVGAINHIALVINTLWDTISNVVSLVSALIEGDWAGAWSAAQSLVSDFVTGVGAIVGNLLDTVFGVLNALTGGSLERLGTWVTDAGTKAGEFVTGILTGLANLVSDVGSKISEMTAEVLRILGVLITEMPGKGSEILSGLVTGLLGKIADVTGTIDGVKSGISGKFSDALTWLVEAGGNILQGLWTGMSGMKDWVIDQATGLAGSLKDSIVGGIKGAFGIGSPSKVIADEIGQWLLPGITAGMDDSLSKVESDIREVTSTLEGSTLDAFNAYIESVRNGGDYLGSALDAVPDALRNKAMQIGEKLAAGLADASEVSDQAWSDFFARTGDILSGDAMGSLSKQLFDLQQQLALADLLGAPEDVRAGLQASIAAVEEELALLAEIQRKAVEGGLISAWDGVDFDAIGDRVRGILDGSYATKLGEQLREVNDIIAFGTAQGWSEDLLAHWREQQDALTGELAQVNQETMDAVAAGLIDPIASLDLDSIADRITGVLDGSLVPKLLKELDRINAVIAFGQAEGWSAELIAAYQEQADELGHELAVANEQTVIAAADGLLSPEALAAYEKAMGIVTQIPLDEIAALLPQMEDGGAEIIDTLVDAIAAGEMSVDDAFGMLSEASGDQIDAMIEQLQKLEEQLVVQLAESLLTGSDPSGIEANLAAITALLEQLGTKADQTSAKLDKVASKGKSFGVGQASADEESGSAGGSGSGSNSGSGKGNQGGSKGSDPGLAALTEGMTFIGCAWELSGSDNDHGLFMRPDGTKTWRSTKFCRDGRNGPSEQDLKQAANRAANAAKNAAPQLGDGGIVPATPGGQLVNVSERGTAEAVIPLDSPTAKRLFGDQQEAPKTPPAITINQTFNMVDPMPATMEHYVQLAAIRAAHEVQMELGMS